MRILEHDNVIRIDPSRSKDYDYDVTLRNLVDFGYNPDDKHNRDEFALHYAQTQCASARLFGEDKIETGTYAFGNASRNYVVHVKC